MRNILGVTVAICVALASALSTARLALPLAAIAVSQIALLSPSAAKKAKKKHHKGGKHKKHNKSRNQRNTKTVVVDRDVHVHDDDDDGSFVGGLIVGGVTATIINEATDN